MHSLPYESFTLDLPQTPPEACAQLATIVEPIKLLRFSKKHAIFEGDINQWKFSLQRILVFERNSFMPQIYGTFELAPKGTHVKISFRMNPFIIVVMLFSSIFLLLVEIVALIGVFTQDTPVWALLVPLLFFAFLYEMMNGLFWQEVATAKKLLANVWNVRSHEQMTPAPAQTTS